MSATGFDIAIVGGGVAGSALATVLARAGLGVCMVERSVEFRDRVRGEGLHPWGAAEAQRLGLGEVLTAAGAQPLPVWQRYEDQAPLPPFHWSDVSVDGLPEYGISHPNLQRAMLAAADAAGATVLRPALAKRVRFDEAGVELTVANRGTQSTIAARLVIAADGTTSAARGWIGASTQSDPLHHRFGGMLLDGMELDTGAAHEARFPGGRVFVLPQGERRARAYLVTAPTRLAEVQRDKSGQKLLELMRSLYPKGALDAAMPAGPIAFFPNADTWASPLAFDRLALVGDAAGANDPSVGNGLSLVFRDVRELRDLLLDGDWGRALHEYARRRAAYFEALRQHAVWVGILVTDEGPFADARRERVERAREVDPSGGGFELIFARGPDGLVADAAARARFFGEAA